MHPEISVICTTFNRESGKFLERGKFLRKALTSVFNQSFENWELIIVDDHSTDNTEKYCKKLAKGDKRVHYIRLDANSGSHSKPKNVGSLAAKAELIAYLDDDNWWEKDHLQALKMELLNNPICDFAYCDRIIHSKKMGAGNPPSIDWHPAFLQQQNYIDTSDVLIKKSALAHVGGWDETLKKFADWNLWVRLAKAGHKGAHVALRLTNYLLHEGSAQLRHKSLVDPEGRALPTFSPHGCYIWPDKTEYGERPKMKVVVVTVTWNREDYLKRTVKSMKKKAGYDFDHIIWNNGKKLKEKYGAEAVLDCKNENVGVPYGYNRVMDYINLDRKKGRPDIVVLTDNDVEFKSDDWLKDIVDLMQITSRIVVSPYVEGLRDNPGGAKRTGIKTSDGREIVPRNGYMGKHYMGFVTFMGNIVQAMPAKFWESFRLKEDTFKHGTQSFQISDEAMKQGYVLGYMENVKVEHMDTTAGQEKADPEYAELTAKMKTKKYAPEKEKKDT